MGLTVLDGIHDFLKEGLRTPFDGKRLLLLGKQEIYATPETVFLLAKRLGYRLHRVERIEETKYGRHIDAFSFFRMLGFAEVEAMDISPYEGAQLLFDLNSAELPGDLRQRFDYIVDGGTLEHVFHVPHALRNIAQMLKAGGKIFHYLPAANWINHGYYSFSPSLFSAFYAVNGFVIEENNLLLWSKSFTETLLEDGVPKRLEDGLSTCIDDRMCNLMDGNFERLRDYRVLCRCIARKTEAAREVKMPVQSHWYEGADERLEAILEGVRIASYPDQSVALWGTGRFAEDILRCLKRCADFRPALIRGFFNGAQPQLSGTMFAGYPVLDTSCVEAYGLSAILVASKRYATEICRQIEASCAHPPRIVRFRLPGDEGAQP